MSCACILIKDGFVTRRLCRQVLSLATLVRNQSPRPEARLTDPPFLPTPIPLRRQEHREEAVWGEAGPTAPVPVLLRAAADLGAPTFPSLELSVQDARPRTLSGVGQDGLQLLSQDPPLLAAVSLDAEHTRGHGQDARVRAGPYWLQQRLTQTVGGSRDAMTRGAILCNCHLLKAQLKDLRPQSPHLQMLQREPLSQEVAESEWTRLLIPDGDGRWCRGRGWAVGRGRRAGAGDLLPALLCLLPKERPGQRGCVLL